MPEKQLFKRATPMKMHMAAVLARTKRKSSKHKKSLQKIGGFFSKYRTTLQRI